MKFFFQVLFATLVSSLASCRGSGTTGIQPDYLATPVTASFNACPTVDAQGAALPGVYPDLQTVTVQNRGKAGGALGLSLSGAGAKYFTLGAAPSSLGALDSVEVPVSFSPDRQGAVTAQLTVDDGAPGTINPTVTLNGLGLGLPAQATLQTGPQKPDGSGAFVCEDGATLEQCSLTFPDTIYGQTATMTVTLRNVGCPTLRVTGLAIGSSRGNTQGFSIDSPAQLPSTSAPLLLESAGGAQELTVIVRFTPTDDDSGNTDRSAYLSVFSNDPTSGDGSAPPSRLALTGNGVRPSISATPAQCDFSSSADLCGFSTAQATHTIAHFEITNDGNAPVQLEPVRFASSDAGTSKDARFTVSRDVAGQTLAPAQRAQLEVTHTDAPLFVGDSLLVKATLGGAAAGAATVQVYGGKQPCLSTDPADQLDFASAAVGTSTRDLALKNGPGCGALTLSQVSVDGNPFFSLVSAVPANTTVPPGGSVTATVQYKRPVSGGLQLGALRIASNDPVFGPPSGKVLRLYSEAPLDKVPVALLTACKPIDLAGDPECAKGLMAGFSASLSGLNPAQLTVSGAASTDDGAVKQYRFTLLPPFPGTVTSAVLANNATVISADRTVLSIPAGATGVYRVGLEVWDNNGQQSANLPVMNLYVTP